MDRLIEHGQDITKHGEGKPEIRNWKWDGDQPGRKSVEEKRLPTP